MLFSEFEVVLNCGPLPIQDGLRATKQRTPGVGWLLAEVRMINVAGHVPLHAGTNLFRGISAGEQERPAADS